MISCKNSICACWSFWKSWRNQSLGKLFWVETKGGWKGFQEGNHLFFYKLDGKKIEVAGANTDKMD